MLFLSHVSGRLSRPWRNIYKPSGLCSTVISNALTKTRTQLCPSLHLDYQAGLALSRFYTTFSGPRMSNTV